MKSHLLSRAVLAGVLAMAGRTAQAADPLTLLNVSYDPTRELWREINASFIASTRRTGRHPRHQAVHGGSSSQARSVIDGLEADVVTLASFIDTDAIAQKGLITGDWAKRLPNNSLPYTSTIVFVVRKGNRRDQGLAGPREAGSGDHHPNPKTSGTAISASSAPGVPWSSAAARRRTQPTTSPGCTGSASSRLGGPRREHDLRPEGNRRRPLSWENEARLEVEERRAIWKSSIRRSAFGRAARGVVDASVDRKKTGRGRAYLKYLYTDAGRRSSPSISIGPVAKPSEEAYRDVPDPPPLLHQGDRAGLPDAHKQFIAEGGVFDRIYKPAEQQEKRPMPSVNRRVLPGFSLSLGYTVFYLTILVSCPSSPASPRRVAHVPVSSRRRCGPSGRVPPTCSRSVPRSWPPSSTSSWPAHRLGAGALPLPGRRLMDSLIDLPLALPTAFGGSSTRACT